MHQIHTLSEGRKIQGQHQHKFPQTCIKFTHLLRAGKHKDSISTSFHRHASSSHTICGQDNTRTASAQVSTDIHQVHTLSEGRKTQGQHQHKYPQTCIKFTHNLRAGKHKDSISTIFRRHASCSHTF